MQQPPRQIRTLVLCFDGTADHFTSSNSNVIRFFSLLQKDDERQQVCYYQAGAGTYLKSGVVSPMFRKVATILDMATAWNLDSHIKDGYRFVMQNYHQGDKICLIGFSRGAYTARALAGFLTKCGLLLKDNYEQVRFAYRLYQRTDDEGNELAARFKETFCRHVEIQFVGVWDTVASVGVFREHTLPFTSSNHGIKTFRHALALDEHRGKFRPNLWNRPLPGTSPQNANAGWVETSDAIAQSQSLGSQDLSNTTNTLGLLLHPEDAINVPTIAPATGEEAHLAAIMEERRGAAEGGSAPPMSSNRISPSLRQAQLAYDQDGHVTLAIPHTVDAVDFLSSKRRAKTNTTPNHSQVATAASHLTLEESQAELPSTPKSTASLPRRIINKVRSSLDNIPRVSTNNQTPGESSNDTDDVTLHVGQPHDETTPTDVLEVWFVGSHADVGGGSVPNNVQSSLSNITLRWMVNEVVATQSGILFDYAGLQRLQLHRPALVSPDMNADDTQNKSPDGIDIQSAIHDQLKTGRIISPWWLIELLPIADKWQTESGEWKKKWRLNMGKGRVIRKTTEGPLNFHYTVEERNKTGYKPLASWSDEQIRFVGRS